MDLAPPSLDPAPDAAPPPARPPADPSRSDRVIGGVAALLAARLGIDAVWIRIAFVLLALVGGIGFLLYLGLWLVLVRGVDHPVERIAGGVLLVGGLPLLLQQDGDLFIGGGWAVFVLLVGLAVALWRPGQARQARPVPVLEAPAPSPAVDEPDASPPTVAPRPKEPREPSVLGRATLGAAVLVAAGGAFIDQANGGRLHPEQWLGAAAIVCGLGLLVGTVRGRARWLVIPALLFAGSGVVAGEAAGIGLHHPDLVSDANIDVTSATTTDARRHVVLGTVDVQIVGVPSRVITVDARVAIGDVRIHVPDDVTVEVRAGADDVRVDGVAREDGTFTVGPEGPPDVVVDARVGYGDIDVEHWAPGRPVIDLPGPAVPELPAGTVRDVADGVAMTRDGSVALADGEALVDRAGRVIVGDSHREGNVTVITTSLGDFELLPGDLLLTPYGELIDLTALRTAVPVPSTTGG